MLIRSKDDIFNDNYVEGYFLGKKEKKFIKSHNLISEVCPVYHYDFINGELRNPFARAMLKAMNMNQPDQKGRFIVTSKEIARFARTNTYTINNSWSELTSCLRDKALFERYKKLDSLSFLEYLLEESEFDKLRGEVKEGLIAIRKTKTLQEGLEMLARVYKLEKPTKERRGEFRKDVYSHVARELHTKEIFIEYSQDDFAILYEATSWSSDYIGVLHVPAHYNLENKIIERSPLLTTLIHKDMEKCFGELQGAKDKISNSQWKVHIRSFVNINSRIKKIRKKQRK